MNYILSETEYNALKRGSQSNDEYYNEEYMRKDITYDVAYNVHNVDKGVSSEAWSVIDAFRSIPNVISVSSKSRR